MSGEASRAIAQSALIFLLITLLEALQARVAPTLLTNTLGGPVSIVAWAVLTARFTSRSRAITNWRDRLAVVAWAAVIGAVSGFVGAFAGWSIYQVGAGAPETGCCPGFPLPNRWYGDSDGLTYWPIVGAVICSFVALTRSGRPSDTAIQ